jgi:hypothetical protein
MYVGGVVSTAKASCNLTKAYERGSNKDLRISMQLNACMYVLLLICIIIAPAAPSCMPNTPLVPPSLYMQAGFVGDVDWCLR